MGLRYITKNAIGQVTIYDGKPPVRIQKISNIEWDIEGAYQLYPDQVGNCIGKDFLFPSSMTIKWRGVRVPPANQLKDLIEKKLWARRKIKARAKKFSFEL